MYDCLYYKRFCWYVSLVRKMLRLFVKIMKKEKKNQKGKNNLAKKYVKRNDKSGYGQSQFTCQRPTSCNTIALYINNLKSYLFFIRVVASLLFSC